MCHPFLSRNPYSTPLIQNCFLYLSLPPVLYPG
jgi:hypothetical protein